MFYKVDQLLSRILPRACVLCGLTAGSRNLCAGCSADLPWIVSGCERCGAPLPAGLSTGCCARCDVATGGIDRIVAALAYQYPVDRLIAGAKFRSRPEFARAVGEALAGALIRLLARTHAVRPDPGIPDLVIPVPLHPARLGQRGFNQAADIAMPVCCALGLRLDDQVCRRSLNTPPQTGLPAAGRRANLRGAFAVRRRLDGLRVAIVDDVVTTGSTVSTLAGCLRDAGARQVVVWAAARVVANQPLWKV